MTLCASETLWAINLGKKCTMHKRTRCRKVSRAGFFLSVWECKKKHFVALTGLAGEAAGPGRDRKGLAAVTVLSVFSRPCANTAHRKRRCQGDSVSQHGTPVMWPHTELLSALTDNRKAGNVMVTVGFLNLDSGSATSLYNDTISNKLYHHPSIKCITSKCLSGFLPGSLMLSGCRRKPEMILWLYTDWWTYVTISDRLCKNNSRKIILRASGNCSVVLTRGL